MKTIISDNLTAGSVIHKFEAAGLGKAPYTFLGVESKVGPIRLSDGSECGAPGQPMGCCQFCGTGIKECYYLRSADGNEFYVGCDCIRKAGDKGLMKVVSQHEAKKRAAKAEVKRQKALAESQANRALLRTKLEDGQLRTLLARQPHPVLPKSTLTLLDYVTFLVERGGMSGVARAMKLVD